MRGRRVLVLTALLTGLTPFAAHAQQSGAAGQALAQPSGYAQRLANYAYKDNLLLASFSYKDVLVGDAELLKRLSNGLKMTIVLRAGVYEVGSSTPVSTPSRVCTVRYDLWEEAYELRIVEPGRVVPNEAVLLEAVFRKCVEARDLAVAERSMLTPGKDYFIGARVDVNPVSEEMQQQIERWIERPQGTPIGPSSSLFGGFVQLFPLQIKGSAKTLTFKTQPFTAP
jgi:hypothetical protein